jgi:predicted negative regulator of RcsB-dependent stress response/Cdc6-like AAA superfamily ATPase
MLDELLQLFLAVGRPSLAQLKENAELEGHAISRSALWYLLNGKGRPRLATVEAFVAACTRLARNHRPPIRLPGELVDSERWRTLHLAADASAVLDDAAALPIIVPRQLPRTADLLGREAELDELDRFLKEATGEVRDASTLVVITGAAGVGKTTLAVSWARRVAERFPDGQLHVDLRGFQPDGHPLPSEEVLRAFLDALDVPAAKVPADLAARAALYRSLVDGRRLLVVLDNANDVTQVRPLLPGSPGSLAIVTSRRDLAGLVAIEGARLLALDVLGPGDARRLLGERLGSARLASEPDAVDRIITRCAGLPIALAVVAAGAKRPPARSLADIADDVQATLDALTVDDDLTADVRAVLSWSYRALPADAARLFRLLGLHPGPDMDAGAIASLAGLRDDQVPTALETLVNTHLLIARALDRYDVHDLVHAYAHELVHADDEMDRRQAIERVVTHYLGRADAAVRLIDPHRDDRIRLAAAVGVDLRPIADVEQAWTWFRTEHRALVAVVNLAFGYGLDEHAWQLARTITTFLDRDLHWHDWLATGTVALRAAERLGHPAAEAAAHRSLAHVAVQQGRLEDAGAHLGAALALFEAAGDPASQAATHNSIGGVCEEMGRYDEALAHAREAHRLFASDGDEIGQAHALNSIGWCEARLGRYTAALASCEQSRERLQQLGDRFGEAVAWDSTGFIRHTMGDDEGAITRYERAVELFRSVGERFYESVALDHLGDCQLALGSRNRANTSWRQALDLVRDLDHGLADSLRAKIAKARCRDGAPVPGM